MNYFCIHNWILRNTKKLNVCRCCPAFVFIQISWLKITARENSAVTAYCPYCRYTVLHPWIGAGFYMTAIAVWKMGVVFAIQTLVVLLVRFGPVARRARRSVQMCYECSISTDWSRTPGKVGNLHFTKTLAISNPPLPPHKPRLTCLCLHNTPICHRCSLPLHRPVNERALGDLKPIPAANKWVWLYLFAPRMWKYNIARTAPHSIIDF